uniref:Uncharacterized protein n=1 Tax=Setaria viridis TaxID=4556 RepID=A0A4U6TQY8_SETVI|nr:hypothetical protein SEVIR_8G079300v2 [Setaria viridis]
MTTQGPQKWGWGGAILVAQGLELHPSGSIACPPHTTIDQGNWKIAALRRLVLHRVTNRTTIVPSGFPVVIGNWVSQPQMASSWPLLCRSPWVIDARWAYAADNTTAEG